MKSIEGINVFLSRKCPEHGQFKTLVSKDSKRFFDKTFSSSGKQVYEHQTAVEHGCPNDCGWCPEHQQHLCTGLIEITDRCNLQCPVCYYGQSGHTDISIDEFDARLTTIMRTENGKLDVLQISGGEPTLHPAFPDILEHALRENIGRILINTNGLSIQEFGTAFNAIKKNHDRTEVYLQFDGFNASANQMLRGQDLTERKRSIIETLDKAGVKVCLAVTLIPENLKEVQPILDLAIKTECITGITFQRFTKTGRGFHNALSSISQEDILQAIDESKFLEYKHIVPLPCSHENCTSISFLFIADGRTYSLGKYIDFAKHQHIIRNKLGFDSSVLDYLKEQTSCSSGGCCSWITDSMPIMKKLREFAGGNASSYKNMKMVRVVVKNFMDATSFDTERAKKCCVGVSVGENRIVPFCVNNIFQYRNNPRAS